ncbi:hypothetical protein EB796_021005 [Bugula neritina]|uniref:Uncharacterized protein n=1 Tax=Bugula neritina TaxID=10212 RepID=A0A7J7J3I5_BUGNE|nr:hypothetical protein EB796_021005 [Bugula neritina]
MENNEVPQLAYSIKCSTFYSTWSNVTAVPTTAKLTTVTPESTVTTSNTVPTRGFRRVKPNKAVKVAPHPNDPNYNLELTIALLGHLQEYEEAAITDTLNKTLIERNFILENIALIKRLIGFPKGVNFVQLTEISWKLKVNSSDELAKVVQEDSLRFGYDFETNIPYSIFATVYNNNNFEFEEYKPAVKNTDAPKTTIITPAIEETTPRGAL